MRVGVRGCAALAIPLYLEVMLKSDTEVRGNGFLTRRLERVLDLTLRRRVGIRDWTMAIVVVGIAQFTGVNALAWPAFIALLVVATSVVLIWLFVFPRMPARSALRMEQVMIVVSILAVGGLVAASGGATSPYVFFYALTMIFVASFVESHNERRLQFTIATLCAAAPIVYDWEAAVDSEFIPLILISLAVWWATCGLVAVKRRSTVTAELQARELAYVDLMTGAANLRGIESYAAELAELNARYAVVNIRIDGVGEINRSLGHFAGDEALRRSADAMRTASIEVDQVGRVGGGEFVVLLPGADGNSAERWVQRFRERLEISNVMSDEGARVFADAGAAAGSAEDSFGDLLAAAASERERIVEPDATSAGVDSPADRARRLRERMAARVEQGRRPRIESIDLPTGPPLSVMAAAAIAIAIGLTGGASSVLISVPILSVTYFAVFGSRMETIFATVVTLLGVVAAVIVELPMTEADQTRVLTVLVTVAIAAYTLQSNSRRLVVAERRAAELSLTDVLTGLPNRTAFERDLGAMMPGGEQSRLVRLEGPPAVIAVDLAGFAATRERLGTSRSDLLLVEVAQLLRDAVAEDGDVYRIGGDDFAVLMRAHHHQHVDHIAAHCADALTDADVEFHIGSAVWAEGMGAPELAAAAIESQAKTPGVPLAG